MSAPITTRAEALRLGQRQYFNGRACTAGHVGMRETVSGYCCVCRLANQNQRRKQLRQQLKGAGR